MLPRGSPDAFGETNHGFLAQMCRQMEPKWSQNGAKMDWKASKNQVRKLISFHVLSTTTLGEVAAVAVEPA